ncbi:protein translocase subunit secB [Thiogranum longum]|uniref:Protein-export protein SecB n=1 Tax=Thiogranum longum TaxID=1537524 RepID=A0A4R1HCA7_9GAMM|nr:protein-export chaperone SecB [Thiogranum longum]TCK16849.1 protein translocase subunit secB [Thiogranum longum]
MTEENHPNTSSEDAPEFSILRTYLKDASFEIPNAPQVFTEDWKPDINLQLNTEVSTVDTDLFEVVLRVTVTAKLGDRTAFLAEIQQAGIFTLKSFDETQKGHMLGAYCPNTLFPFAREAISDLVIKGGFPQLLLAPINFDVLYAQNIDQISAQVDDKHSH